jgi:hypothetical protein
MSSKPLYYLQSTIYNNNVHFFFGFYWQWVLSAYIQTSFPWSPKKKEAMFSDKRVSICKKQHDKICVKLNEALNRGNTTYIFFHLMEPTLIRGGLLDLLKM